MIRLIDVAQARKLRTLAEGRGGLGLRVRVRPGLWLSDE